MVLNRIFAVSSAMLLTFAFFACKSRENQSSQAKNVGPVNSNDGQCADCMIVTSANFDAFLRKSDVAVLYYGGMDEFKRLIGTRLLKYAPYTSLGLADCKSDKLMCANIGLRDLDDINLYYLGQRLDTAGRDIDKVFEVLDGKLISLNKWPRKGLHCAIDVGCYDSPSGWLTFTAVAEDFGRNQAEADSALNARAQDLRDKLEDTTKGALCFNAKVIPETKRCWNTVVNP